MVVALRQPVASGADETRARTILLVDPGATDPARRYKLAYFDFTRIQGQELPGLCVAFSPDGIHWTKHSEAPLLRAFYGDYEEPVPFVDEPGRPWAVPLSASDATDAFYDPVRWTGQVEGELPPEPVMIRVHLERATVYALTLHE